MRRVKRDWTDIPDILTSTDASEELEDLVHGIIEDPSTKTYKGEYTKNKKLESTVREKLNKYYYHKCCYCELHCKAEIEHYRPKKGVTGVPKNEHRGYYWLAYEWTNLLPSCRYCNTEGGKHNHFTIQGTRVAYPNYYSDGSLIKEKHIPNKAPLKFELPYLLHPEIDNPKLHLGFYPNKEIKGVDIIPIDLSSSKISRGSETIRICNLNREYLRLDRVANVITVIYLELIKMIKLRGDGIIKTDEDLKKALIYVIADCETRYKDKKCNHTLLWWYLVQSVENFKKMLFPLIEKKNEKLIIEAAFINYFNKKTK
jgi:uncharacterized protein (TIGR02646 family)